MKNWIASIQDNISRADLLSEHYLSHAPTSIITTFDAYISQVTSFRRLTQLITVNRTKKKQALRHFGGHRLVHAMLYECKGMPQ